MEPQLSIERRRRALALMRREFINIPNVLTYGRIAAIPLVAWLLWRGDSISAFLATALYGIAAGTDYLDGYLARKLKKITIVGKFLDPLADKLLVITILLVLIIQNRLALWIAIVLIARETAVTALRALAASEGLIIAAKPLGKYKTAFQMCALVGLMVHYDYIINTGLFYMKLNFHRMGTILLYIALFYSIISAIDYFYGFFKAHRQHLLQQEDAGLLPPE